MYASSPWVVLTALTILPPCTFLLTLDHILRPACSLLLWAAEATASAMRIQVSPSRVPVPCLAMDSCSPILQALLHAPRALRARTVTAAHFINVQVSQATAELLRASGEGFTLEPRGVMNLKGKGADAPDYGQALSCPF